MLHLGHCLSLRTPGLSVPALSLIDCHRKRIYGFQFRAYVGNSGKRRRTIFHSHRAEKGDSGYEVDPEKAREALRKLDEQLQSLSQKQIDPPKIRASELDRAGAGMREEVPEITGSFLAYLAFVLLLFTIFYNVLFLTVIKPSIDGSEGPEKFPATSAVKEAPKGAVL